LHPELIPVMSLESRKFAEEKYDVARVNEEMFKLINLSSYEKNI
ncbi:MAG TPA: glycosyltransferase family 1 protein, partial [Porticoccaceae bacterium]|nr:glycosyltransferase family 1 protein [Porticoccaceae bacterium]